MSNQVYSDPATPYRSRIYTHVLGIQGAFNLPNYTITVVVSDQYIDYILPNHVGTAIADDSANSVNALPDHLRPGGTDNVYANVITQPDGNLSVSNSIMEIQPITGNVKIYAGNGIVNAPYPGGNQFSIGAGRGIKKTVARFMR